eukprot:gene867-biopygen13739
MCCSLAFLVWITGTVLGVTSASVGADGRVALLKLPDPFWIGYARVDWQCRTWPGRLYLFALVHVARTTTYVVTLARAWRGHGAGVARAIGHFFGLGGAGVARAWPVTPGIAHVAATVQRRPPPTLLQRLRPR